MTKTAKTIKISFSPRDEAKKMLQVLRDRDQYVLENRFGLKTGKKKTLDSIGKEFSVTRERVRQIENAALDSLRKSNTVKNSGVFNELREIIHGLGGVVPESHLMSVVADNKIDQNHINLYLVLGDEFHLQRETDDFNTHWYIDKDIRNSVYGALRILHKEMTDNDLLSERDMVLKFLDRLDGIEDRRVDNYIAKLFLALSKKIGVNKLGEWGRANSPNIHARGVRDLAHLAMRKNGSPMHFTEIANVIYKMFGKKANPLTVHNEVIKDDRFVLVGRGLYGLCEWGYRPGVLREVITSLIQENGPMSAEQVLAAVRKERHLKDATILATLKNKKYFKRDESSLYYCV